MINKNSFIYFIYLRSWTAPSHAPHCYLYFSQKNNLFHATTLPFAKQWVFLHFLSYMAARYHLSLSLSQKKINIYIGTFYGLGADSLHRRMCWESKISRWDLRRLLTPRRLGNTEISLLIQLSAQQRHVWVAKCSGSGGVAPQ